MINIIFFGSDEYSLLILKALVKDKRFKIIAIVTLPHAETIRKFGQENKIPQIETGTKPLIQALKALKPDVGILASFGRILPKEILAIPKHGLLNIHPSLLPKYRGPSPGQTAILNGNQETGVTIIKMDEKIDHGLIVSQFKEKIKPDDTAELLYKRLFSAGAEALKTILPAYLEGQIEMRKQDHKKATYTKKLIRKDGKINWKKSDEDNERFIRAMHPWPGTWTKIKLKVKSEKLKVKKLKILKAHLGEKSSLVLDRVQLEGKKPVSWKQFQEGYPETKFIP